MESEKLLLSALRSLWGILTPNVRKVSVCLNDLTVSIHFYYNNGPSDLEIELSEEAATELISSFPSPFLVSCNRHTARFPEKIQIEGFLVYARYEEQ